MIKIISKYIPDKIIIAFCILFFSLYLNIRTPAYTRVTMIHITLIIEKKLWLTNYPSLFLSFDVASVKNTIVYTIFTIRKSTISEGLKFIKDLDLTPIVICEYGNILKSKLPINNVNNPNMPPTVGIKMEKVKFRVTTEKYNCMAMIEAVPNQPINPQ